MKSASFVFAAYFLFIAVLPLLKYSASTRMRINNVSAKNSTKLFLKSAIQTFDKASDIYYNTTIK